MNACHSIKESILGIVGFNVFQQGFERLCPFNRNAPVHRRMLRRVCLPPARTASMRERGNQPHP